MSKFYITTAIPYVNDKPHLGHAMLFILGDALARYRRDQGDEVIFSIGTDEHGGKILEKATELKLKPQALVDSNSLNFRDMATALNIKYDRFIRTTDPAHIKAAQDLWKKFAKDIYKSTYKGWYCTGCEKFVSEKEVEANKGVCPLHNRPYEQLEEENYFFKLSKYTEPIKQAIEDDTLTVVPASRKNEILAVLGRGLEDISFSRPKDKIPWGIEVPGDPKQMMYVWVDALINYLSAVGYPAAGYEKWWPADLQVLGKDILRFHAAIWPAMLLASGLPMPKVIYAHGFITIGGKKMSKSLGNAVDPLNLASKYGVDAFRYYILHEIPGNEDGDFSQERLDAVYNGDLANDLGNLVQRTAAMVSQYQKGVVGEIPPHSHDVKAYHRAIENYRLDRAIDEIWQLVRGLNQYVDEEKPWELAKARDNDPEHLGEVLGYLVSNVLQVGRLLRPFLPETATKIEKTFEGGVVNTEIGVLFPKSETA